MPNGLGSRRDVAGGAKGLRFRVYGVALTVQVWGSGSWVKGSDAGGFGSSIWGLEV